MTEKKFRVTQLVQPEQPTPVEKRFSVVHLGDAVNAAGEKIQVQARTDNLDMTQIDQNIQNQVNRIAQFTAEKEMWEAIKAEAELTLVGR